MSAESVDVPSNFWPLPSMPPAISAYVWELDRDAIEWSARLGAGIDRVAAGITTGRGFAEHINPDDLVLRQPMLGDPSQRASRFRLRIPPARRRRRLCLAARARAGAARRRRPAAPDARRDPRGRRTQGAESRARAPRQLRRADRPFQPQGCARRSTICSPTTERAPGKRFLAIGIDKLSAINDALRLEAADQVLIEIGRRLDTCLRVSDVSAGSAATASASFSAHCPAEHVGERRGEDPDGGEPRRSIPPPARSTPRSRSAAHPIPSRAKTSYDVMTRAESGARRSQARRPRLLRALPRRRRAARPPARRHAVGDAVQRALRDRTGVRFAYQPVVDGDRPATSIYYECLLRMIERTAAIVPAGEFVAAIEQLGFIRLIDRYVLEKAIDEAVAHPGICLGFNISGLTATDRAWLRALTAHAARPARGREPARSSRSPRPRRSTTSRNWRGFVATLRELGCRVALDDFGAGFTSLRHLQALAVDTVKIDGSFVRNLASSPATRSSCAISSVWPRASISSPSRNASRPPRTRRSCAARASTFLQGYYYGRPTTRASPGGWRPPEPRALTDRLIGAASLESLLPHLRRAARPAAAGH